MKNKKGFTLIELMAVIILLGLIIMIIVPKITDSIENSKKNAAIDSALGYVKSARDYYNINVLEKDYVIKEGINWIQDINSVIEVDGDLPTSGYFYLKNGKIEFAEFCVDNYYVTYEKSSTTAVKTPDCLIDKIKEELNPSPNKYVSYVEGAKKAILYRRRNEFDDFSTLRNPPGSSTMIYYDKDENIMNIYYGYTFDTTDEEEINNYKNEIENIYGSDSIIILDNIYQDENISVIFILEHNMYFDNFEDECYLNYEYGSSYIIPRLDSCMFASDVDFDNPYKILEF